MKSGIMKASLSRGSKHPAHQVARSGKFCTVKLDICRSSVRRLLHIASWASKILRWLEFLEKCHYVCVKQIID
jgi:hypothetical protein